MNLLLRSTDIKDSEDEKKILDWFVENFGEADARDLVEWVWARERNPSRYVLALFHIAREVKLHGKVFVQRILDHARSLFPHREKEEQLMAATLPFVEKARITIQGHRGDEMAVEESMRELRVRLRENIRRIWPEKHRATIDGAIVTATQVRGAACIIDFRKLVTTLAGTDALAETAAGSHGVTDDR
jgi:hypothetical protein